MKAKRIFRFLLPALLLFLSACQSTISRQAEALRESRGTLPQAEATVFVPAPQPSLVELSALPVSLSLDSGQRGTVAFRLPEAAPPGGLLLRITTDIPGSIIMPEASIPEGERSVNVPMEGGDPGQGSLYVEAEGCRSVTIPVSVR